MRPKGLELTNLERRIQIISHAQSMAAKDDCSVPISVPRLSCHSLSNHLFPSGTIQLVGNTYIQLQIIKSMDHKERSSRECTDKR